MKTKETKKGVCVEGFKAAGVRKGKYGLALISCDKVCATAGVFTKNSVKAAPVLLTKSAVKSGIQAIVANSGSANACVKDGVEDAKKMAELTANAVRIKTSNVGVASTGIIGRRLDMKLVSSLIEKASKKLSKSSKGSLDAAKAIMTTDTKPKQVSIEHKGLQVGGICKGAGMLEPNMATMLCFITTNAKLSNKQLQTALKRSVDKSFNMTVVDADMSTNDTVLLLSSGKKKCSTTVFQTLLDYVTLKLAKMMVMDAEGASKYFEVEINNARDSNSARKAAKSVVSSSLVKTALYGENPNWGRIEAAIGSKIKISAMKLTITLKSSRGSVRVFDRGVVGNLEKARKILKDKEIYMKVNLRLGSSSAKAFGCDLTEKYVKINAGYN